MTNITALQHAITNANTRTARVEPYSDGIDLILDETLYNGENLTIHATATSDTTTTLTDSGQLAASLFMRGVDLTTGAAAQGWHYITQLLHQATTTPTPGTEPADEWELSLTVTNSELHDGLSTLAAAMLRVDGLGAFANTENT